jgi:hypothetical protein
MNRQRLCFLILLCSLGACTTWQTPPASGPEALSLPKRASIRVTRTDGRMLVLKHARVVGDSLFGEAGDPPQGVAMAMGEIRRVELQKVDAARTVGLTIGVSAVTLFAAFLYAMNAYFGGEAT